MSVTSGPPGQLIRAAWRYLGLSRSKFGQLRKKRLVPPPVDLPGGLFWRRCDLDRWLEGLPPREGPDHAA